MTFFGLPQFVWEIIANVFITLGAGLIIAYFTSTFLKKREEKIRISGTILEKRINCEQEILTFLEKENYKYEMPKDKHKDMLDMVSLYGIPLPYGTNLQYSVIFTSPKLFEKFMVSLENLFAKNRLWMDVKVRRHLLLIQAYYSFFRVIPVILHRLPLPKDKKLTDKQYKDLHKIILWQCGIIFDDDLNMLTSELEELIVSSIYKLDLSRPKKSITRQKMQNAEVVSIQKEISNETKRGIYMGELLEGIEKQLYGLAGVEYSSLSDKERKEMMEQAFEDEIYQEEIDLED